MDNTIVAVVVGGVIAAATNVVTNVWTDRRLRLEQQLEQKRWEEAREREAEERVYEHRRSAIADFLTEFRQTFDRASMAKMYDRLIDPPEDVLDLLGTKLTLVKLYASPGLGERADAAYRQLVQYVFSGGDSIRVASAFEQFVAGANEELARSSSHPEPAG